MEKNAVNTMWLTSTLFNQMLMTDQAMFDGLTNLLIGGEKLSEEHVRMFKNRKNGVRLINGYGPTEGTTFTTTYQIPENFSMIPIGKAISNTKIYILEDMSLCGIGVPGELCIAGDGVSRGYLNQPELNQEKFVKNPYGEGMLYRSGDLARWMEDGNIEYLGRMDEQVKIRGFRIEPGEIETVLLRIITDAAVIVKANEAGEKAVYAYFTAEKEISVSEFRKQLRKELPEYMIPAYMMQMEKIPVTTNGKLDKRALPEIQAGNKETYEAPVNPMEETITNVFTEVLMAGLVGRNDGFFELGGDSIKAIRLVSKLREKGMSLSVKDVIQLQTPEELAKVVNVQQANMAEQGEVTGEVTDTQILKLFQKWELRKPEHFNQAVTVNGADWTLEELETAMQALAEHHDMLRSVYRDKTLVVLGKKEAKKPEVIYCDLTGMEQAKADEKASILCEQVQESFDLANGSLIKAVFVNTDAGSLIMITAHHLIVDGVSWRILLEDLETIHRQLKKKEKIRLPEKTESFIKWSKALNAYGDSKQLSKEKAYWDEVISKVQICLEEQNVFARENSENFIYQTETFALSKEETERLVQNGHRAYHTQMNDLLLSAVARAVYQIAGISSYAVVLEGHGREERNGLPQIDRTVGWFTSMYPVLLTCGEDTQEVILSNKEMLRKVPAGGIGYGILGYEMEQEPELSFNYLGEMNTDSQTEWAGFTAGKLVAEANRLPARLNLNSVISNGNLNISLLYDSGCYQEERMKAFISALRENLLALTAHCEKITSPVMTPSDYPAKELTQKELENILAENKELETICNLTNLQEGMVFEGMLGEGTQYVIQSVYAMHHSIDTKKLEQAFVLLSKKHEVLRAKIYFGNGKRPKLLILKDRPVEWKQADVSEKTQQAQLLEEIIAQDLQRGFQLDKDVLMRATCVKMGEKEYRLIVSFHHVIMDGWCLSIVLGDLIQYYNRLQRGETYEALLEETAGQQRKVTKYSDYLAWLEEQEEEEGLSYFEELLADYEESTGIQPLTEPEKADKTMERIGVKYSESLSSDLRKLAKDVNVTLNTLLEAAWGITLWQYNRTTDSVFGKVVSGRNASLKGIEETVGLFINTIPVRVKADDKTVKELLADLQKQANEGNACDFVSLSKIQQATSQGMDLIKTLFAFENYYVKEDRFEQADGLTLELLRAREETGYAVTVSMNADKTNIYSDIMYNPNEFATEDMKRILERMEAILKEFVKNPDQKATDIPEADAAEEAMIKEHFNQTKQPYEENNTYAGMFEEQVRKTPDKTAVKYAGRSLTYEELNKKANVLANRLIEAGVKEEDYVGVAAERGIEMITAIFAVLKAGAAYVPIDPTYPEERIHYMLNDCRPKAILTYIQETEEKEKFADVTDLLFDLMNTGIWEGKEENPVRNIGPDNVCYLIYTSGTTGKPKGVMIENHGVMAMIAYLKRLYQPGTEDHVLQFANYIFDASVWEMTMALLSGACLTIASKDEIADSNKFHALLQKEKISISLLPPQYCIQVNPETLRILTTGGSQTNEEVIKKAKNRYINAYGPTENTVLATHWEYDRNSSIPKNVPIGKPIDNTKIYIMNGDKFCGIGIPGEICITGAAVARGYLNREELTKEKFIKNPFGKGTMYRSGDLGRWLPDGNIEYLGRIDQQVKIRGFRIELGEIENVLRKQDGIIDAAVVAKEDGNGEKAIYAYFTGENSLPVNEVKEALRKDLPDYMIPAYMMQMEAIPLNRSGKVDTKALPEIEGTAKEYIAPRNEKEAAVCAIFGEILGRNKISIEDNFFEIGGHSLRATRLVNRIEAEFGMKIRLKEVFEHPTAEGIARLLSENADVNYEEMKRAEEKTYYPMSSAQKRIYRMQQVDETGIAYNMPQGLKLKGHVDLEAMKSAFVTLLERHEVLRTSFIMLDGREVQKINKYVEPDFKVLTLEEEEDGKVLTELIKPFDLENGNIIRMYLVKRVYGYLMYLDIHHIAFDGTSMGIYLSELVKVYNGQKLEGIPRQYKDYSEWMAARDLSGQKAYWEKQFADEVPVLNLPLDLKRPNRQCFDGDVVNLMTGKDLACGIKKLAKETQTTEYMIWLSAIQILLSKYSRQEDIIVGSPIGGRTHKDTESMIGMFVNTLAMRGKPEGRKTYAIFLEEIKDCCLKAYDNQDYPFEELVEAVVERRDISRNPLFDVMFILQNLEGAAGGLEGISIESVEADKIAAKMDLSFDVYDAQDDYKIRLEYGTKLFRRETAVRIGKQLIAILQQIIKEPNLKIADIICGTQEEIDTIQTVFNQQADGLEKTKTIVELFEEQVLLHPGKTAVIYNGTSLTYQELNEKANTIAYALREKGIKPNDYVALITEKSIQMIIGAYGIMKAGGAYVPIDPSYPEDRIRFMLKDCQAKAVVFYAKEADKVMNLVESDTLVFDLDKMETLFAHAENLERVNKVTDLAYVIYTSGTTGKPKGVMVEHHGISNLRDYFIETLHVTSEDVVLQYANVVFDGSVWEMNMGLLTGAALVIASKEQREDVIEFEKLVKETKVTVAALPPVFYANVSDFTPRILITAGSEANKDSVEKIRKTSKYVNSYGPSECTVAATHWECSKEDVIPEKIPIGKPIPNVQVYIVNQETLCGILVPGEICISGLGVARGYVNRPELTQEKFVKNPFGEGMLYRTGDLGRWLPDGNIEFLGRIDKQVKIRGFRVEIGEIEQVIRKHAGVLDVAVIAKKEENQEMNLFAYYTAKTQIEVKELKEMLRTELPEYMVPAYMMQMESIPVTKNGKVDEKALPEIKSVERKDILAPRNELEQVMYDIFTEILGSKQISITDNFYEIGGDSIKAIRIVSKMREAGYDLSVKDIMRSQTIEKISYDVSTKKNEKYAQGIVSGIVKKTPILKEFDSWNLAQPEHFNQSMMLNVKDAKEADIRMALTELAIHHDALRAVYRNKEFLILSPEESSLFSMEVFDYRGKTMTKELVERDCTNVQKGMDLEHGPLLRTALFVSEQDSYLLIAIHHLVVDGVSWRILLEDFEQALAQRQRGERIVLPDKTASYQQWGEALEAYKESYKLKNEKKYWDEVCRQLEEGKVPGDKKKTAGGKTAGIQVVFDEEVTKKLLTDAHTAFNTEINDLLLSAVNMAFYSLTGQKKLAVGLEGHGREEIHEPILIDRTVGWFTISYPVILACQDDIREAVVQTKEQLRKIPNHGLGYGLLYEAGENQKPDVYFNYLGQLGTDDGDPIPFSTGENIGEENKLPGDILLNGSVTGGKLLFALIYDTEKYSEEMMQQLADLFKEKLSEIVDYLTTQEAVTKTISDYGSVKLQESEFDEIMDLFD